MENLLEIASSHSVIDARIANVAINEKTSDMVVINYGDDKVFLNLDDHNNVIVHTSGFVGNAILTEVLDIIDEYNESIVPDLEDIAYQISSIKGFSAEVGADETINVVYHTNDIYEEFSINWYSFSGFDISCEDSVSFDTLMLIKDILS